MKWGVLAFSIVFYASVGLGQVVCEGLFAATPAWRASAATKNKALAYEDYATRVLVRNGKGQVDSEWLDAVKAILASKPSDFLELIPKRTFPKADRHRRSLLFSNMNDGIRTFDPREGQVVSFKPQFYHQSSGESAPGILQNGLLISTGTMNHGAICLGDSRFFLFKGRKESHRENIATFQVTLRSEAKILDLTTERFGGRGPTEFSYSAAFEWYQDVFLTDVLQGKYADRFSALTAFVQSVHKETGFIDYSLMSPEAFGLLLGADVLYLTQRYESNRVDEYWVINPLALDRVQQSH